MEGADPLDNLRATRTRYDAMEATEEELAAAVERSVEELGRPWTGDVAFEFAFALLRRRLLGVREMVLSGAVTKPDAAAMRAAAARCARQTRTLAPASPSAVRTAAECLGECSARLNLAGIDARRLRLVLTRVAEEAVLRAATGRARPPVGALLAAVREAEAIGGVLGEAWVRAACGRATRAAVNALRADEGEPRAVDAGSLRGELEAARELLRGRRVEHASFLVLRGASLARYHEAAARPARGEAADDVATLAAEWLATEGLLGDGLLFADEVEIMRREAVTRAAASAFRRMVRAGSDGVEELKERLRQNGQGLPREVRRQLVGQCEGALRDRREAAARAARVRRARKEAEPCPYRTWEEFVKSAPRPVRYHDIPFPSSEEIASVRGSAARFRDMVVRWHPDKFQQRVGAPHAEDRARVAARLNAIVGMLQKARQKLR